MDTDIPDRMKDGYGLNQMLIESTVHWQTGVDTSLPVTMGLQPRLRLLTEKKRG